MCKLRLSTKYIRDNYFIHTILGKHYKGNLRNIKIGSDTYDVNSVRVLMIGTEDSRFNFKVNKGLGMFVSARDGKYTLPITTNQHMLCSSSVEENCDYIKVTSGEGNKAETVYVKIGNVLV